MCWRKRLTLRGFIVWDFAPRQADFLRDMGEWVGSGRVTYREDVVGAWKTRLPRFSACFRARTSIDAAAVGCMKRLAGPR